MPSDTAWLMPELTAGPSLAKAYDGLTERTTALSTAPKMDMGSHRLSPRALASTVENLRSLGIDIDENNRVLRGLRAMIITNYSLYALYSAYRAYVTAQAVRETAMAAKETAEAVASRDWKKLIMASAAASMVASSFGAGYELGSGNWKLPSIDWSNPTERRKAKRQMQLASATSWWMDVQELGATGWAGLAYKYLTR